MPLSNNTVSSRIYEMSCNVEVQVVEKLNYTSFSILLNESTVRYSDTLLMAYVIDVNSG